MLRKEVLGDNKVRVTFEVSRTIWADHITLVGDFNDWDAHTCFLQQTYADEDWHISVDLEAGHSYCFRYLVDEQEWMDDDHADGYVVNSHGDVDCVVST
jgi:1,4-alpha-glucan branching enzyme